MTFGWFKKEKGPEEDKAVIPETGEKSSPPPGPDSDESGRRIPADLNAESRGPQKEKGNASEKTGFFNRLKLGLSKTRNSFTTGLEKLFIGRSGINDDLLEELEELLIISDIGFQTTTNLIDRISKNSLKITDPCQLKTVLKNEILTILNSPAMNVFPVTAKPFISMVVGVNGAGKTTTIGKLAAQSTAAGKKVLLAAADTFRAAAIEQLTIWADRSGSEIVKHKERSDPAAVTFDALEAAEARGVDIVLVDTAGRLHTKVNLMEELKKMKRIISKKIPGAPHEVLLILDATTGQNALAQAKIFHEALDLTGIAITKLDGTAKGGIVISIGDTLKIPLKYIGVGEKIGDLQTFDPVKFVDALF